MSDEIDILAGPFKGLTEHVFVYGRAHENRLDDIHGIATADELREKGIDVVDLECDQC